jgi:PGF-pre-PGF domain-containing protein
MRKQTFEQMQTVSLLAIVLLSTVAFVPVATADATSPSALPEDQLFEATESVAVWERAPFPLRSDNTRAEVQVTPPEVTASVEGLGERSLVFGRPGAPKNPVGSFGPSQTVSFDFDDDRALAPSSLDGQDNVQVVAARLEGTGGGVPNTFGEAAALLSERNANANASFYDDAPVLSNYGNGDGTGASATQLDSDGDLTFDFHPPKEGQYVVFVVVNESATKGIYADADHDIRGTGNVTVLGVYGASVHRATSEVSTPVTVARGDSIDVTADASAAFSGKSGQVTHVVAVYDRNTFRKSRHRISVDRSALGPDFDLNRDSTLETSISEVVGVANVEDGVTINGEELSNGRVARGVGIPEMVDFIAEDVGTDAPKTTAIGDEKLYASVTAVTGEDPRTTVPVETVEDWRPGVYKVVHVAKLDGNAKAVSVNVKTVRVTAAKDGRDDRGQDGDNDEDEDDGPPGLMFVEPATTNRTASGEIVTMNATSIAQNTTVSFASGANITSGGSNGSIATVSEVNFTVTDDVDNGSVAVTTTADTLGETDPLQGTNAIGYVDVSLDGFDDTSVRNGTFTFRLADDRRERLGVSPGEVQLYRHVDGQWRTLDTTHLGGDRYRAGTPGFSTFAIGAGHSNVSVTTARLEESNVTVGTPFTTAVTVENTGTANGTIELALTANESVLTRKSVSVARNSSTTVQFDATVDTVGQYDVRVNGTEASTLAVSPTPTTTTTVQTTAQTTAPTSTQAQTPTEQSTTVTTVQTTSSTGPGFSVLGALGTLLAAVLLWTRRKSK